MMKLRTVRDAVVENFIPNGSRFEKDWEFPEEGPERGAESSIDELEELQTFDQLSLFFFNFKKCLD